MSNCAHHISLVNPTTWAEMTVPVLDSTSTVNDITLNKVEIVKIYFHDICFWIMVTMSYFGGHHPKKCGQCHQDDNHDVSGSLQLAQRHSALPGFR